MVCVFLLSGDLNVCTAHVDYIKRVKFLERKLQVEKQKSKNKIGHHASDIKHGFSNEGISTCMSLLLQTFSALGLDPSLQEVSRWKAADGRALTS